MGCSPLLGDSFLLWLFHMPSFMQLVFIDYSVLVHSSYSPILLWLLVLIQPLFLLLMLLLAICFLVYFKDLLFSLPLFSGSGFLSSSLFWGVGWGGCVCVWGGGGGELFEEFLLLFIFRSFSCTDLHVCVSVFFFLSPELLSFFVNARP